MGVGCDRADRGGLRLVCRGRHRPPTRSKTHLQPHHRPQGFLGEEEWKVRRGDFGSPRLAARHFSGQEQGFKAGGFPACSRWLSAAAPPDHVVSGTAPRQGVLAGGLLAGDSIEVTLVVFDAGFQEEPDELLTKGFVPVVFLLAGDVVLHRRFRRSADGEGCISFLPMEEFL